MALKTRLGQIGVPALLVGVVVMMVVPLPAVVLDLLLAVNITGAVLILLVSMYVQRALDFAIFPSLLLIATLFRLALNVSATRLVLLHGDAGKVIESFGHFVVGGSLVVGLVVFLILIIIQFVVITHGATRVAEVGARFTLDAMPGKQMAIDADLNAGLIDEDEARRRRGEVAAEADFYGAMDGASKFVKGDAVAAIVITAVNLFGGFIVGVVQKGMPVGEAVSTYSLLSVGDGLVSQIPALLISISTGLIVTRSTSDSDMGSDLVAQFARQGQALQLGGAAMVVLALVPGLPKLPFLLTGGTALLAASRLRAKQESPAPTPAEAPAPAPDSMDSLVQEMRVEPLELQVAYDLIDLVDASAGGDLLERVRGLRRKLAVDLGVVIPLVRTRDNLDLPPHTYAIRVHGVEVARGQAPSGSVLAIGDGLDHLPGIPGREPVFGLAAKWIPLELRLQAEMTGATVVDRASVITTHLAEVVRQNAGRLLGREDVKALVDMVKATHPVVVEELTPGLLSLGEVQRVLQALLDEHVPIRDLVRIFEALSTRARSSTEPEGLVEAVRSTLGPAVSAPYAADGRLPIITFDPLFEQALLEALRTGDSGSFLAVDAHQAEVLATGAARVAEQAEMRGDQPVLVCSPQLRPAVRKLVRAAAPHLPVLSYAEIGTALSLEPMGVVTGVQAAAA